MRRRCGKMEWQNMRILNSGKLITNQTAGLIWDTRTGNIRDFTSICVIRDTIRKWNKCRHVDRNFSFELLINNLPQGWLNCGWEAVCISRVGFKVAFCHSEMCQSQPARASQPPPHRLHFIKFHVSVSQYNLNTKPQNSHKGVECVALWGCS